MRQPNEYVTTMLNKLQGQDLDELEAAGKELVEMVNRSSDNARILAHPPCVRIVVASTYKSWGQEEQRDGTYIIGGSKRGNYQESTQL